MKFLPFLLLLCCCSNEVKIERCDSNFRDTWWLIDPTKTESFSIDSVSFYINSKSRELEIISYNQDWHEYFEWKCIDINEYKIQGKGTALAHYNGDNSWLVSISLHKVLQVQSEVTESYWEFLD